MHIYTQRPHLEKHSRTHTLYTIYLEAIPDYMLYASTAPPSPRPGSSPRAKGRPRPTRHRAPRRPRRPPRRRGRQWRRAAEWPEALGGRWRPRGRRRKPPAGGVAMIREEAKAMGRSEGDGDVRPYLTVYCIYQMDHISRRWRLHLCKTGGKVRIKLRFS